MRRTLGVSWGFFSGSLAEIYWGFWRISAILLQGSSFGVFALRPPSGLDGFCFSSFPLCLVCWFGCQYIHFDCVASFSFHPSANICLVTYVCGQKFISVLRVSQICWHACCLTMVSPTFIRIFLLNWPCIIIYTHLPSKLALHNNLYVIFLNRLSNLVENWYARILC